MADNAHWIDEMQEEADHSASSSSSSLERAILLSNDLVLAKSVVDELEDALAVAKGQYNLLQTKQIPALFLELGITKLALPDGREVQVGSKVYGSLPKGPDKRKLAVGHLEALGAGSLIQDTIELAFPKSQHNVALDVLATLQEKGIDAKVESGVHAATLCKFAREAMESGDAIDLEVLGLFQADTTTIKEPKKPRGGKVGR